MIPSWLKRSNSENEESLQSNQNNHQILGTPINSIPMQNLQEEAFFACGCFWGAEKGFWKLPGVYTTAVGYAGGQLENPTYRQVCTGRTGHTEIVKVIWDKALIGFSDLLKLFWECHDPTQGNRQGNDTGSQYRSAIYTTTKEQIQLAGESLKSYQVALSANGFGRITTELKSEQTFFYAEEYHQQYLAKPGSRPYCSAMPTKVKLGEFNGSRYKLPQQIWSNFDWSITHCVLRSDNNPIKL